MSRNKGLSSTQLEDLACSDKRIAVNFLGVFARDELPNLPQEYQEYPLSFIFNTDPRDQPGKHWLGLFFPHPREVEFFDSYGLHPRVYGMSEYLEDGGWRHPRRVKWNDVMLQQITSKVCGHYCLMFLWYRCRQHDFVTFVNSFRGRTQRENDDRVCEFVCTRFVSPHRLKKEGNVCQMSLAMVKNGYHKYSSINEN